MPISTSRGENQEEKKMRTEKEMEGEESGMFFSFYKVISSQYIKSILSEVSFMLNVLFQTNLICIHKKKTK